MKAGVGGKGNGRACLEERGEGKRGSGRGEGVKDRGGESGQMDLLCYQELQTRRGRLWVAK